MGKNNKGKQPEKTPQESEQIQDILANYRQIATNLKKSRNEEQIGIALAPIFDAPEAVQLGLLKMLAKERTVPAADIVLAVNTYTPVKEVRKEARRSLIQLEGTNIYPEWTMPSVMSLSDILGVDDTLSDFEDGEDDEDAMDGENVIERFLRYWGQRDFELAYGLLTANSPLKAGLTREEWSEQRHTWATEAEIDVDSLKIDVGYTLEVDAEDALDDLDEDAEELDAFWSIEMKDVPDSSGISELPTATLTLQATGRHWFWASYTFLMEGDELRIHSIRDKGAEALQLSKETIEEHLEEIMQEMQAMSEELTEDEAASDESDEEVVEDESEIDEDEETEDEIDEDEDLEADIDEVRWFTKQSLHYCDALIAHNQIDNNEIEGLARQADMLGEMERAAAYFTVILDRNPANHGDILRLLGAVYAELVAEENDTYELDMEEEENTVEEAFTSRYFPLAEKALRDAMATDNDFTTYILLADLYFKQNNRIADISTLFDQAEMVATKPENKVTIEVGRARLAQMEEKPEEALAHFQRAIDLDTKQPGLWASLGSLQLALEQTDAAEKSFLKSIVVDPTVTSAYAELATIYVEQHNDTAAMRVLAQGIDANPFAADIMAAQAMLYINAGNLRKAEELIEEAEEIDPDMEIVFMVRQVIDLQKLQIQQQQRTAGTKSSKSKKKR